MYLLHHDGETTVHDSREQAVKQLLEDADATLSETKLTPEVLNVEYPTYMPFCMHDTESRVIGLFDTLAGDSTIGNIADNQVVEELEAILRDKRNGREPPHDLHPTDCDDWEYEVRAWFEDRVDEPAFDDEVVRKARERFVDVTRDEIQGRWSDISDRIGNPAAADIEEIEQERDRLQPYR